MKGRNMQLCSQKETKIVKNIANWKFRATYRAKFYCNGEPAYQRDKNVSTNIFTHRAISIVVLT